MKFVCPNCDVEWHVIAATSTCWSCGAEGTHQWSSGVFDFEEMVHGSEDREGMVLL